MTFSDISNWLNNKGSYEEGVKLYAHFGTSEVLKDLFETKTTYSVRKLSEALEQLLACAPKITLSATKNLSFKTHTAHTREQINPDLLPEDLRADYFKLGDLYKTISFYHNRLDLLSTDQQRYEAAEIIVKAANERRAIYQRIDNYIQPGGPAPVVSEKHDELDLYEASEKLKRVRVQVSKLKNNPQRQFEYRNLLAQKADLEARIKILKLQKHAKTL